MTVKDERKCLSEIRSYCGEIPENFVLSNGMKAEDFALMYVLGHQLKRKEKQSNSMSSNSGSSGTSSTPNSSSNSNANFVT